MRRGTEAPGKIRPSVPRLAGLVVVGGLLLGLLSCQWRPEERLAPDTTVPGPRTVPEAQAREGAQSSANPVKDRGRGTLVLRIRWPERDLRGFRAALIPTSTRAIHIRITHPGGTLTERLVTREPGGAPTTVAFDLPATSNLGVQVKAYREANPTVGVSVPIAQGTAAGQNLGKSQVLALNIGLTAAFVPAIASMSVNVAQIGDTFTLSGDNLGPVEGFAPAVSFNGEGGGTMLFTARGQRAPGPGGPYGQQRLAGLGAGRRGGNNRARDGERGRPRGSRRPFRGVEHPDGRGHQ